METDRSLATLLRALQTPCSSQVTSRLLGSATTLLTLLSNPLNVTLLTSQILTTPAVWQDHEGLQASIRVLGVFSAASVQKSQNAQAQQSAGLAPVRDGLAIEKWVEAVVRGSDERSPRWKHLLVLGGLLGGFESQNRRGLSSSLRKKLEGAVVNAANLALADITSSEEPSVPVICIVLGHTFELLNDWDRGRIDYDSLQPLLMSTIFFSKMGLHWGYFLGAMDADVIPDKTKKFNWPQKSASYIQIQGMFSGLILASLGSLSRLMAQAVSSVKDTTLLARTSADLVTFTRSLGIQWQQNKLSELDPLEEAQYLTEASLQQSIPLLWRSLKSTLFAIVVIESSLLGRIISDRRMPIGQAPVFATETLRILRNLYFISSRLGRNSLTQYTFMYITAIDIMSQFPARSEKFLHEIRSTSSTSIPEHPLERCLDLFFLNTAEHFANFCSSPNSVELLLAGAAPYLEAGGDPQLLESFEAAHSVMLSVFTASQNQHVLARHLRNYIEKLFMAFPLNLSPRQFRLAIRTLVRVTAPPSPISAIPPLLYVTLFELIHGRIATASPEGLPVLSKQAEASTDPVLSERAALVMTLIDSLPLLPIPDLGEWLTITAQSMDLLEDPVMLQECRNRFWDVLSSGVMDVDRAQFCVVWWNMHGGKEMVLYGSSRRIQDTPTNGIIEESSKL